MILLIGIFDIGAFVGGLFGMGANAYAAAQSVKAQKLANEANIQMTRETNAANKALAEYSFSQNLAQWERENAYNSPSAQMSRLRAAGLNPNLIYGNSSAGVVSASSPEYKAPEMRAAHVEAAKLNLEGFAQSINNMVANTALLDAKKRKIESEIKKNDASTKAITTEQSFKEATFDERVEFVRDQRKKADQEVIKAGLNTEKLVYETQAFVTAVQQMQADGKPYAEYVRANIINASDKLDLETAKVDEQIEYIIKATANLVKDATLKDDVHAMNEFEIELNKLGLTKSDDVFWRLLYQGISLMDKFGFWDKLKKVIKGIF